MSEESDADRLHSRALELREDLDRRVADDWDTIKDLTFDGPNDAPFVSHREPAGDPGGRHRLSHPPRSTRRRLSILIYENWLICIPSKSNRSPS